MVKKYTIFVDSSYIRNSKAEHWEIPLSTEGIKSILKFIIEQKLSKDVIVVIPEIVVQEVIFQKLNHIKNQIDSLSQSSENFKKVFSIEGIDLAKYTNFDFDKFFKDKCQEFMKKYNLEQADTPKIDQNELINRSVNKLPPFKGKTEESDKGFKDTILWYSILEFVKKEPNHKLIFLTTDDIFEHSYLNEEITKINKSGIRIFNDPTQLKAFLNTEFKLNLDWKAKARDIKNKLKEKLGILIEEIYKENYFVSDYSGREKKVISYDYKNINFTDISGNGPSYRIDLKLELIAKYKSIDSDDVPIRTIRSLTYNDHISDPLSISYPTSKIFRKPLSEGVSTTSVSFDFMLDFNENTEEIFIISVTPNYPLTRDSLYSSRLWGLE